MGSEEESGRTQGSAVSWKKLVTNSNLGHCLWHGRNWFQIQLVVSPVGLSSGFVAGRRLEPGSAWLK